MTDARARQGWGWPANADKAHWFDGGSTVSLCRQWSFLGERHGDASTESHDDCRLCRWMLAGGSLLTFPG